MYTIFKFFKLQKYFSNCLQRLLGGDLAEHLYLEGAIPPYLPLATFVLMG